MLGRTKGIVIRALTNCWPLKPLLYKRYDPGIAISRVSKVETPACQSVNQIISSVLGSASVESQFPEKPIEVTCTIGQ
jgi:hypothetical protein